MSCSCLLCCPIPPLGVWHKRWKRRQPAIDPVAPAALLLQLASARLTLVRTIGASTPSRLFALAGALADLDRARQTLLTWQLGRADPDTVIWVEAFAGQCTTPWGQAVGGRTLDLAVGRWERARHAAPGGTRARHHLATARSLALTWLAAAEELI